MWARLGMFLWLGAWDVALFWGGDALVRATMGMWREGWIWTGFLVLLLAFACVLGGLRLLVILAQLGLGYSTPRLARRDFRNSVANALFFLRSGGMLRDP